VRGPSTSPLDVALESSVPPVSSFGRAFMAVNRVLGAFALVGGLGLVAKCAWHLLTGAKDWSQSYFAVFFGVALVIAGIVYLRAPLWRRRREAGSGSSSQDH